MGLLPHEAEGQKAVIVEGREKECELSSIARVEAKTQQVWKVRNEVQRLQKVISETMVSTVTTSALENCVRDSEVLPFLHRVTLCPG